MLKHPITVLVHSTVGSPNGKLYPNKVYELEDSDYVRSLIKGGIVSLIDPPSLDPAYLGKYNYELCEGYVYSEGEIVDVTLELDHTVPQEDIVSEVSNGSKPVPVPDPEPVPTTAATAYLKEKSFKAPPKKSAQVAPTTATTATTAPQETSEKSSEEVVETTPEEKDDSHENGVQN